MANLFSAAFAQESHRLEINAMELANLESGQRKLANWLKIQSSGIKALVINEIEKGILISVISSLIYFQVDQKPLQD